MGPVSCSFCDKSFVSECSLSSRRGRCRRENGESETGSNIRPLSGAASDDLDVGMDCPASACSDADATVTEESHRDGSGSEEASDGDGSGTESSGSGVSSGGGLECGSVRERGGGRSNQANK